MGNSHKQILLDGFKTYGERSGVAQYMGEKKLNLGCGSCPEPVWNGWDNADINPRTAATLIFDMRDIEWPIEWQTYDTVLANMVLQHFSGKCLFRVMKNINEALKPGGYLVAEVPYGMTGSPLQESFWNEATPMYFCKHIYFDHEMSTTCEDQLMPLADWEVPLVAQRQGEDGFIKSIHFVMRKPLG